VARRDARNDNGTDGQTDGQTDRQSATHMRPPDREEGRIIIVAYVPTITHGTHVGAKVN